MRVFCLIASCLVVSAVGARGLTIEVDFSYDSVANGGTGFFASTPLALAAVQKAAADLSLAIGPSLGAVPSGTFQGSSGGATATFEWTLDFENPSSGADVTLPIVNLGQDVFTIYVGMRQLGGNTLGQGGPAGVALSAGISGNPAGFAGATTVAENASNAVMPREAGGSGGPIMGTFNDTFFEEGPTFSLSYGALAGNLWFDIDTNNNGTRDSAMELANFWSFDANAPVQAGKNDFYSVALHEILHSLGIGTSDSWDDLRSGTTWLGSNARALNGGSGANLVTGDGHIASGLMSTTLFGGVAQEVAMDPSIFTGTRKFLTEMDAAFLRDIGFVVVPEPSSALLAAVGVALLGARRGRRRVDG